MKILIISDAWHPQINGVVRTYELISEELVKMGHDVRVIGPGDFRLKINMPFYSEIKLVLFPYRNLEKMILEYNPDIVHVAVEGPLGWAGRKYCVKHNVIFSTSYHTHFPYYLEERINKKFKRARKLAWQLGLWYVRKFHAPSNAIMVATPSLEADLRAWNFKNHIHRLTRGVRTDVFYPDPTINLFPDLPRPVALYVGRVSVEKNVETFMKMPWEGGKIIVGDGPSRSYLEKKYPSAVFTGKKSGKELADLYRSADLFVFPSKTDTFGIVLLEALATGLPVAAYPVTGPVDILTEDGLAVLDEDLTRAACEAVKLNNPQQRIDFIKAHYTWSVAAKQFLNVFDQCEND